MRQPNNSNGFCFSFSVSLSLSLCVQKQLQFTNENSINISYSMFIRCHTFLAFYSFVPLFPSEYDMFIRLHFHMFVLFSSVFLFFFFFWHIMCTCIRTLIFWVHKRQNKYDCKFILFSFFSFSFQTDSAKTHSVFVCER